MEEFARGFSSRGQSELRGRAFMVEVSEWRFFHGGGAVAVSRTITGDED